MPALPAASSFGLSPELFPQVWRAHALPAAAVDVWPSGFSALDAELPGGGWPSQGLTELLQPQAGALEWRLLAPGLRALVASGRALVLIGPPQPPHLPGLRQAGLDDRQVVWLRAETAAERLWCAEQLLRAQAVGALVLWLPQARPEQVRRLQLAATACEGPVFVCRPLSAAQESSAAPLRVRVGLGPHTLAAGASLHLSILKRRGPLFEGSLELPAWPGAFDRVLPRRVGSPSPRAVPVRPSLPASAPAEPLRAPSRQADLFDHALGGTSLL
jgi:protein ImuA